MFDRMVALGEAETAHLNVMLRACVSAAEQAALVKRVQQHSPTPLDAQTFFLLVSQVRRRPASSSRS